jgi:hypothetical protein
MIGGGGDVSRNAMSFPISNVVCGYRDEEPCEQCFEPQILGVHEITIGKRGCVEDWQR